MPFCSQCGTQVTPSDLFCSKCGVRQPIAAPPPRPAPDPTAGLSPRAASILCYLPGVGWIAAVAVLASSRFRTNRTVRFNAFQGLYLFVAWLLVHWVIKPMFWFQSGPHVLGSLLQVALLVLSIFMMVKASEDRVYPLPILGEMAERSLSER